MKSELLSQSGVADLPDGVGSFQPHAPQIAVVDNFYENPDAVRELALRQTFRENIANHKGARTREKFLFPYQKEAFERLLGVKINGWLTHQYNGIFQYCTEDQPIVFHSDQQAYAAVIYLTPDAPVDCGTSFYRSKETGVRRPAGEDDARRLGVSIDEANKRTYHRKLLSPEAWDLVDTVGNVYNRLVIWDAQLIHAASRYFGDNVNNSRLFHLFFFDVF